MKAIDLPAPDLRGPPDLPMARRRDVRRVAGGILLALIIVGGGLLQLLPGPSPDTARVDRPPLHRDFDGLRAGPPKSAEPEMSPPPAGDLPAGGTTTESVRKLLAQAARQNEARRHDDAIATLNQVRPLDPDNAEAYMRVGDALLGKKDYVAARDFYLAAIDRNPVLSGAYFGFAVASEELGDLESAIGGMRSYLHVEPDKAPGRLPVAQARSAIWEWESRLGRGPWGPTKGIPPGWTADEIKRDGRGVGVKMQKIETLRPDGTMDYEIKAGDRFPELWRK